MDRSLFASEEEYNNFLTFKANQRITELESDIGKYTDEIEDSILNCDGIFSKYNVPNYLDLVCKVDEELKNADGQKYNAALLEDLTNKRDNILDELKTFLEDLDKRYMEETLDLEKKSEYLSNKEDIEFAFKQITYRNEGLNNANQRIVILEENYPDAHMFDVESFMENSPTFKNIRGYANPDKTKVSIKKHNVEKKAYVVKISEAPEYLLHEESKKEENNEESAYLDIFSDTSFYGEGDKLTEEISGGNAPEFEEIKEDVDQIVPDAVLSSDLNEDVEEELNSEKIVEVKEETPNLNDAFVQEEVIDEAPVVLETSESIQEETKEENNDEIKPKPEEEIAEEKQDDNSLSYTMENGDTLYNLAYALGQDENLCDEIIEKIIERNKETIEPRLKEKNITDFKEINENTEILAGLSLIIPDVLTKEQEKPNVKVA